MPGENPPPDEQEILPSIENLVAVDMVPSVKSEVPETESETADSEPVQTSSKPWWAYLLVALGLLGLGVAGWAVKQHLRPRAKAQVAEEPAETSEEEMPEEKRREAAA
jgi:flagellar biosynthesis/type III secretory pathway M-ring protein FliF/YscJ